jgi:hypothetical protein
MTPPPEKKNCFVDLGLFAEPRSRIAAKSEEEQNCKPTIVFMIVPNAAH